MSQTRTEPADLRKVSYPCRNFAHMFEGSGFGVGLAVNQLSVPPYPGPPALPDGREEHPTRLGELMPVRSRCDAGLAEELRRANMAEHRLWAYRVEMIVELAYRRRADRDRRAGTPGAASPSWGGPCLLPDGVSEFLPDEVALIMNFSLGEATRLIAVAWTLSHSLEETWAALADGRLSWSRARAMAEEVHRHGLDADPQVVAAVEAVVLPEAADLSISRLRARLRTEFVRHDADAADERRRQARAAADVFVRRSVHEGMSEVVTRLPLETAAAVNAMIDRLARQAKADGDVRPIGVIRAEISADLVLRPWNDSRPSVTAELRVIAPLNSLLPDPADPACDGRPLGIGEVEGEPVTAAHLRALLSDLDAICPGGLQAPVGGTLQLDLLGADGDLLATLTRDQLESAVARGCPDHPTSDCGCGLVGRPPPTRAYEPTVPLRRWVWARDRGCRHPGCGNRSGWADLDHVLPHAEGGHTDCDNLCCLCRRHHRLKTHAPGWTFFLDRDGALLVTTPSGVTRVSRPPGTDHLEPGELGAPLSDLELFDVPPF